MWQNVPTWLYCCRMKMASLDSTITPAATFVISTEASPLLICSYYNIDYNLIGSTITIVKSTSASTVVCVTCLTAQHVQPGSLLDNTIMVSYKCNCLF